MKPETQYIHPEGFVDSKTGENVAAKNNSEPKNRRAGNVFNITQILNSLFAKATEKHEVNK